VYGASEGLKTVVIERYAVGGQAGSSPKIENFLGFPEGISGADLAERAREQACRFGAEILVARAGIRGEVVAGKGIGYLDDGTKIIARASVCATGVDYRKLGLPNEDRLFGAGVYYGVTSHTRATAGGERNRLSRPGSIATRRTVIQGNRRKTEHRPPFTATPTEPAERRFGAAPLFETPSTTCGTSRCAQFHRCPR
jgi:hypothetical protein